MPDFRNQMDLIDVELYDHLDIGIVGLGSIGSFVAMALNKLGFKHFLIIDDDKIEKHNIPNQYYSKEDVGKLKVESLMKKIDGKVTAYPAKLYPSDTIKTDVVFVCVDSLKQRKGILKSVLDSYEANGKPSLIIDGRMHRLVYRVYTVPLNDKEVLKKYTESLLKKEQGGPCTEKGIIQNVFAVVAVMLEQFRKIINGAEYSPVINCDFERLLFISEDERKIIKEEEKC